MKYQVVYTKPNSEHPLQTYKPTKEDAFALAEQLRAAGYGVDVWEHSEAGARRIDTDYKPLQV